MWSNWRIYKFLKKLGCNKCFWIFHYSVFKIIKLNSKINKISAWISWSSWPKAKNEWKYYKHTLSSILSYIYLHPGAGWEPWISSEHLLMGCILLMTSSSELSSPCSSVISWAVCMLLSLECTTNLVFLCPNGVTSSEVFLKECNFPFVIGVASNESRFTSFCLAGEVGTTSLASSCSSLISLW